MSHPQSYEILLVPEFKESGTRAPGAAVRSAVVEATGDTGASGYPRYSGGGMEADIDPATHTVEALLVDGAELGYALSVRIAERTDRANPTVWTEPADEGEQGDEGAGAAGSTDAARESDAAGESDGKPAGG